MLEISNLKVLTQDKNIINSLNLTINKGEIHAIMGPNGAGKSTLAKIISTPDGYEIADGSIRYFKEDIADFSINERANKGIFMGFQHPIEIPGLSWNTFLKAIVNAKRIYNGEKEISSVEFIKELNKYIDLLKINPSLIDRSVNEGFSGGEKKKFEILQMLFLKPNLIILDEIDSGLDIDALKIITENINNYHNKQTAILIITHYPRILQYLTPSFVHIFHKGNIVKSGTMELANTLDQKGYDAFITHESK